MRFAYIQQIVEMSFPTKKFHSFSNFLKNDLHTYIHAQLIFSNIIGFDQEELETLYAESFQKEFSEYCLSTDCILTMDTDYV